MRRELETETVEGGVQVKVPLLLGAAQVDRLPSNAWEFGTWLSPATPVLQVVPLLGFVPNVYSIGCQTLLVSYSPKSVGASA